MNRRKKLLVIAGVIVVVIAVVALYVNKEYNRTHKDTADLATDYSITVTRLIKEFEEDEQTSNGRYWNKVIQAEGMVKDIAKDDRGFYSVVLGDTSVMSSVRCSMDSVHNKEAATLQKGNRATLKGICTGFNRDDLLGSDVILIRCMVDSKK